MGQAVERPHDVSGLYVDQSDVYQDSLEFTVVDQCDGGGVVGYATARAKIAVYGERGQ